MLEMPIEPRSTRRQRLRRLFLLPTGKRRKTRDVAEHVVIPPKPITPPRTPAGRERAVSSEQALDAVMRKLSQRALAQAAAHEAARAPALAPVVAALTAITPAPDSLPAATVLPRPRVAPKTGPVVKVTTLGATPPSGVAFGDPTGVPAMPVMSPDEFLMTEGWARLFDVVSNDDVDTLSFTLRQGGAAARVSDTTIEIPKIPAEPEQVPHLCKHCHELRPGDSFGGRMWRCHGCKMTAAY